MQNDQASSKPETIPVQILAPYQHVPDNEINLSELWQVLVNKKSVLLGTIVIALAFALMYLATTDKTYKTNALTLPPAFVDSTPLNTTELFSTTSDQLYAEFLSNVSSVTIQRKAFDNMMEAQPKLSELDADERNNLFNHFAGKINIPSLDENKESNITLATTLSIESSRAELSKNFLDYAISEANSATIQQNFTALQKLITDRLVEIPKEIERLTLGEKTSREQTITRLEEEITIKRNELAQKITAVENKLQQEKLAKIAQLEERDAITRNSLLEKIKALREKAKTDRYAKITRLEENNQLETTILNNTIEVLRKNAADKRKDQIHQLKEALNIAISLNIKEPLPGVSLSSSTSPMLYAEITTSSNEPSPLYLRGEKALRAEIKELETRPSDDPFIVELRPLLDRLAQLENNEEVETLKLRANDDPYIKELPALFQQLAQLETNEEIEALKSRTQDSLFSAELLELNKQLEELKVSPRLQALKNRKDDTAYAEGIKSLLDEQRKLKSIKLQHTDAKAVRIDRDAYTIATPIKPKTSLTIALALIAGLMLGVFFAFFSHFIQQQKNITS